MSPEDDVIANGSAEERLAVIDDAEVVADASIKRKHSVTWWIAVAAGLIAAGAFIIAIVASFTISSLNKQLDDAKDQQAANRVETTCRAKATADLDIARANLDVVQGRVDAFSAQYDIAFNDLIKLTVFVPADQRDNAAIAAAQDRIAAASKGEQDLQPQLDQLAQAVTDAAEARKASVTACIQPPPPDTPTSSS